MSPEERREAHRESNRKWAKKWRINNPKIACSEEEHKRQREKQAKWREDHYSEALERGKKAARKWRFEHPEESRIRNRVALKKWRVVHYEEKLATTANRKAKIMGLIGSHTAADIRAIYEAQDGLCYYCGEPLGRSFHRDHKEPVSRGGSNGPDNMCCTCQFCNLSKGDKTEAEFVLSRFSNTPCQLISLAK
jgi:hypothetical protein